MPNTMIAKGSFPTRRAANQAVQRLVSSGFARNSIDLERHDDDDGYDLMVHTRRENLDRVENLIHTSPSAYNIRSFASGAVQTAKAHPLILLGTGVIAGLALYSLFAYGSQSQSSSSNSRSRSRSRRRSR